MTKSIVYLFGAGSTIGELSKQGYYPDLNMSAIADAVLAKSISTSGPYAQLHKQISIPPGVDIEFIISLLEGFDMSGSAAYEAICVELRNLFKQHVVSE